MMIVERTQRFGMPLKTLFAILTAASMIVSVAPAYAKKRPGSRPRPDQVLNVSSVMISDKAHRYNHVFVGEKRFKVSPSAEITYRKGKKLPLESLPIPCQARITYEIFGDNRDPMIIKIELR